jgi:tRNA (Thr-GGU) A37 N-methylase
MSKITKRPKKEVVKTDAVEKATIVAKEATQKSKVPSNKVPVKELQLELQVKEQQLEDALEKIQSLEHVVGFQQKEKVNLVKFQSELETRIKALLSRGLVSRILNTDV